MKHTDKKTLEMKGNQRKGKQRKTSGNHGKTKKRMKIKENRRKGKQLKTFGIEGANPSANNPLPELTIPRKIHEPKENDERFWKSKKRMEKQTKLMRMKKIKGRENRKKLMKINEM